MSVVTAPTRTGLATIEAVPRPRVISQRPQAVSRSLRPPAPHTYLRYGSREDCYVSERTMHARGLFRHDLYKFALLHAPLHGGRPGSYLARAGICWAMIHPTAVNMLPPSANASGAGVRPVAW